MGRDKLTSHEPRGCWDCPYVKVHSKKKNKEKKEKKEKKRKLTPEVGGGGKGARGGIKEHRGVAVALRRRV